MGGMGGGVSRDVSAVTGIQQLKDVLILLVLQSVHCWTSVLQGFEAAYHVKSCS